MRTVVITKVVHASSSGAVFQGYDMAGAAWRLVANPMAMPRPPVQGEVWEIDGRVRTHPVYGRQVAVERATLERPSGAMIINLLKGPHFPDIGETAATALWDRWGEDLYRHLDEGNPAALLEALGGGWRAQTQVAKLIEVWPTLQVEQAVYLWLDRHGIPPRLGCRIIECYDRDAISKLEENPYRLIAFTGWVPVDAIARCLGMAADDPRRLVAGVEAALYQRYDRKHTWTPGPTLRAHVAKLLGDVALAEAAISRAAEDRATISIAGGWQALGPHIMEGVIAAQCVSMIGPDTMGAAQPVLYRRQLDGDLLRKVIRQFETREGYALNREQKEAVHMAATTPLSVLTGGAGVGKTSVLKCVGDAAEAIGWSVHQMALSGRAALRIQEATGRTATTIASWLKRVREGGTRLDDEPLLLIDEGSMIDLPTMYQIVQAMGPGCKLLLVGDPAQLPPIGPGLTFHALAACEDVPQVRLTEVMRQSAATGIPAVAAAIRRGEVPALDTFTPAPTDGVSFIACTKEQIVETILDVMAALGGPGVAQVVGSIKGGGRREDAGIVAINSAFHTIAAAGRERRRLFDRFLPGEPILWTENDYSLGLMNGNLGYVLGAADAGLADEGAEGTVPALLATFDGETKSIPVYDIERAEHAYAISCHKSQGSQFERVIVPVMRNRIMDRTLLYTAVTRAQKQVVLVGDRRAFEEAVAAAPSFSVRETGFFHRLRDLFIQHIVADRRITTDEVLNGFAPARQQGAEP